MIIFALMMSPGGVMLRIGGVNRHPAEAGGARGGGVLLFRGKAMLLMVTAFSTITLRT